MNNIASIAQDIALEIILGADRLDKDDADFVINRDNLDRKELREQTKSYIIGVLNSDITPFVVRQLDYWYGE